jgi:hypothetical protein
MREIRLKGRGVYSGIAEGEALVTKTALPGYGGVDPETGNIIDIFHELYGTNIVNKIMVIRGAKGSSGWAETFHIARLLGTTPAGIVFTKMTSKICLGIVAMKRPAITDLETDPFEIIETGDHVILDGNKGEVTIFKEV